MEFRRTRLLRLSPVLLLLLSVAPVARADWPPVPREQLEMKEHPMAPGAHAVILDLNVVIDYGQQYTQVASDVQPSETVYQRIKIFTEEGRKYGDIQIPYLSGEFFTLSDVEGRTIQADGTIRDFDGQVHDKVLFQRRGQRIRVKAFALPEVKPGSIIEFRYKWKWHRWFLPSLSWEIQTELFIARANFAIWPVRAPDLPRLSLLWVALGLPEASSPKPGKDGVIRLTMENIPALRKEGFMPPEKELKTRVHFYYTDRGVEAPEAFWKREGREWHKVAEEFMSRRGPAGRIVQESVAADDSPETKLRKLYTRVQKIRNLSYERTLSEAELKRLDATNFNGVDDVLSRNMGRRTHLARTFVALARAAKLEAWIVRVSSRDEYFFNRQLLDPRQLNEEVALVRMGDQFVYLDPGARFCPFGMLSWENSGVQGIRLDKDGGEFLTTPVPRSQDSAIERNAELRANEEGALEGILRLTFTGQQARDWRVAAGVEDREGTGKRMKEEIESWLPAGATVKIGTIEGLEDVEQPLRVEAEIRVANFATVIGRRFLLPAGLFHSRDPVPFAYSERVHPVYFDFPFQEKDRITVSLPPNYTLEAVPEPIHADLKAVAYRTQFSESGGRVVMERHILVEGFMFRKESYGALRSFFELVRGGDAGQLVSRSSSAQ